MADKGMFDLEGFESAGLDDVLKLNIFEESSEPATPNPSNAENKEIPVPKGTSITLDTYNSALAALKKSFKEGAEIMEMLENAKVVENTNVIALQEAFTENAIDNAMFESYENGPYFERADSQMKAEIKKTVAAIRKKINVKRDKYSLCPSGRCQKLFSKGEDISSKSWQTVGIFYSKTKTIKEALEYYRTEFKDELEVDGLSITAGKLVYDTALTNPHIESAWGWGLIAALFMPIIPPIVTGFIVSQVVGKERARQEEELRDACAYLLIVTDEDTKIKNIKLTLSKEDIAKAEKLIEQKEGKKDKK